MGGRRMYPGEAQASETHVSFKCGHCEKIVQAEIVQRGGFGGSTVWLLCPNCHRGSVAVTAMGERRFFPQAPSVSQVPNLPPDVDKAWREARVAFTVAAYTAAEIMCRKILMHIAVDIVGSAPDKSFAQYVADLDEKGYIVAGLRPVVDRVRDRGNIAAHELPNSTEAEATTTLKITEHLLHAVYALPGLAQ